MRQQLSYFVFFLLLSCSSIGCQQGNQIQWIDWKEANEKNPHDKKGFVWLYADWCTTSEFMMDNVLQEPAVIDYINANFYPIKFNGETTENIQAAGKSWKFVEQENPQNTLSKGFHQLALALTDLDADRFNKGVPYPRIIFLDEAMNRIVPVEGNLTEQELFYLLEFVATDQFKQMSIDQFIQRKKIEEFKK